MKIGITGMSGFIGGSIADALLREGHQVVSLDKHTSMYDVDINHNLNSMPSDLDWLLHFAASTSIEESFNDPFSAYSNNLESTLVALKIAHQSRSPFLFMSSYVYGKPEYSPIDESHPLSSLNPYMGSKIVGEEICKQLCDMLKISLIILRGFNIYGNAIISGRLISDMLLAVKENRPLILNDPTLRRDYLYIKDFEKLIIKIISHEPVKTGTYNVGCGKSYSNLEVAEMFRKVARSDCELIIKESPRLNDAPDCLADNNLVKETFSWEPTYSLEMGLCELIDLKVQY